MNDYVHKDMTDNPNKLYFGPSGYAIEQKRLKLIRHNKNKAIAETFRMMLYHLKRKSMFFITSDGQTSQINLTQRIRHFIAARGIPATLHIIKVKAPYSCCWWEMPKDNADMYEKLSIKAMEDYIANLPVV